MLDDFHLPSVFIHLFLIALISLSLSSAFTLIISRPFFQNEGLTFSHIYLIPCSFSLYIQNLKCGLGGKGMSNLSLYLIRLFYFVFKHFIINFKLSAQHSWGMLFFVFFTHRGLCFWNSALLESSFPGVCFPGSWHPLPSCSGRL